MVFPSFYEQHFLRIVCLSKLSIYMALYWYVYWLLCWEWVLKKIFDTIPSFTRKVCEKTRETSTVFYVTTEYDPKKLYSQVFRFQVANICKTRQDYIKM